MAEKVVTFFTSIVNVDISAIKRTVKEFYDELALQGKQYYDKRELKNSADEVTSPNLSSFSNKTAKTKKQKMKERMTVKSVMIEFNDLKRFI